MTSLRAALLENVNDAARVDAYYLPVADWLDGLLARNAKRPYFLGISGPQGSGKSTLAAALVHAFSATGRRALTISADDFYLTRAEQVALAAAHPHDPLFEVRGFAGTHDVDLGANVLGSLARGAPVKVPSYDKSAHGGLGDRAPESTWRHVGAEQDLVVFEGWFLGFPCLPKHRLDEELWAANAALLAYTSWTNKLDAFLLLEASAIDSIVKWRVGSERARRERGERTMSEADAERYIERFLPVYRAYVPNVLESLELADKKRTVLGEDRSPLAPL